MLRVYIISALRNLKKDKLVSFINIAGLSIGLACAVLAILFSFNELSYENCHEKADKICRVYTYAKVGNLEKIPVTFGKVGTELKERFPEINKCIKTRELSGIVMHQNKPFSEDEIVVSESGIFSIFNIPFLMGTNDSMPGTVVISEKMAVKYYGKENPVGQNLTLSIWGIKKDYKVTGVFYDLPNNTHLKASFILPFNINDHYCREAETYNSSDFAIYTLLGNGVDVPALNNKILETYDLPVN